MSHGVRAELKWLHNLPQITLYSWLQLFQLTLIRFGVSKETLPLPPMPLSCLPLCRQSVKSANLQQLIFRLIGNASNSLPIVLRSFAKSLNLIMANYGEKEWNDESPWHALGTCGGRDGGILIQQPEDKYIGNPINASTNPNLLMSLISFPSDALLDLIYSLANATIENVKFHDQISGCHLE